MTKRFPAPPPLAALALTLTFAACSDSGSTENEGEVITTVRLTFTPTAGTAIVAAFRDEDGDGGNPPTVDPINLVSGSYALSVELLNELESPAEDITQEVSDEADEHQIFFTGTAVNGPATSNPSAPLAHTYSDTDTAGLPIGLTNTIVATPGSGSLVVTLRHLPAVNDQPVKIAGLAGQVRTGGLSALPGESDAQVTFQATVTTPP